MAAKIDSTKFIGVKFGKWTVLSDAGQGAFNKSEWLCRCECGKERAVQQAHLRAGRSTSCGCSRQQALTHGGAMGKDAGRECLEYRSWRAMKARCNDPSNKRWPQYGGRGIEVCERWSDFSLFLADMGSKPTPEHTLDRIDTNGNYEPGNCRWATGQEQMRNTTRNRVVTINGVSKLLCEWCDENGIAVTTVLTRMSRGWSEERAVQTPAKVGSRKAA